MGDFLAREQKLARVAEARSIGGLNSTIITPNDHGDWLNQRGDAFDALVPIEEIFTIQSSGLKTNRDAWNYNASKATLAKNTRATLDFYNQQVKVVAGGGEISDDATRISWDRVPLADVRRGKAYEFLPKCITPSVYRPFFKVWSYPDRQWNNTVYRLPSLFAGSATNNCGFYQVGTGSAVPFSVIALGAMPDLHVTGAGSNGRFFARWRYEKVDDFGMFDVHEGEVVDGYRRIDNITDEALAAFTAAYPGESITKDDIFDYVYGLLHSPEYRETYAADLKKMLPRIPFAHPFRAFADAGKRLAELHLGYEAVEPYPLEGFDVQGPGGEADYGFFAVRDKKMTFGKPSAEHKTAGERHDKSVIHYNDRITVRGIPAEAYRYTLGSRSAIEWIIDRYWVKTDKASGIVNDPNDWSREVGDPRYVLDLLARIVTVSLQTMRIVDALPPLGIRAG